MESATQVSTPGEVKSKRRWWIAPIVGVVLVAAAIAALTQNRSEFAFLGTLGPTNVFAPSKLKFAPPPSMPEYRYEILYYDKKTAPKVLEAMTRELTKSKGFTVIGSLLNTSSVVSFVHGTPPYQYGAVYSPYDSYQRSVWDDTELPPVEPGGCMVVIATEPNWWQRKWKELLRFLRLEK